MSAARKAGGQVVVLEELKRHGSIARAARVAGITRKTIYNWRDNDKAFAAAMKVVLREGRA